MSFYFLHLSDLSESLVFLLAYSAPGTLASLLFFRKGGHSLASGPLHVSGMPFTFYPNIQMHALPPLFLPISSEVTFPHCPTDFPPTLSILFLFIFLHSTCHNLTYTVFLTLLVCSLPH